MQDVTAGRCLQDAGQNGRDFTPAEKAEFTQCGFSSMEAFELNEHLECDVRILFFFTRSSAVIGVLPRQIVPSRGRE